VTTITVLFDPPQRGSPDFSTKANQFALDLVTFSAEMNAIIGELATVTAEAAAAAASAAQAELAKLAAQGAANFVGDYSAGTTYSQGQCVLSSSVRYVSRVNSNIGNTPASSPTQWLNITATGTVTSVSGGTGVTISGGGTVTPTVNVDKATDANIRAAASNKVLTADTFNTSMAVVTSSGSGAFTLDFNSGRCFHRTLTSASAATINNPSNVAAGQGGLIFITNAASPATLAIGSNFKWVGGTPSPTIGGASSKNKYAYYVLDTSNILIEYIGTF